MLWTIIKMKITSMPIDYCCVFKVFLNLCFSNVGVPAHIDERMRHSGNLSKIVLDAVPKFNSIFWFNHSKNDTSSCKMQIFTDLEELIKINFQFSIKILHTLFTKNSDSNQIKPSSHTILSMKLCSIEFPGKFSQSRAVLLKTWSSFFAQKRYMQL